MNRNERLVLLSWFVVVLLVLLGQSLAFGLLGIVAGVVLGLPVGRSRALKARTSGDLVPRGGLRLQKVVPTLGAHLAVVLGFVLVAAVVPGLRDRFVALLAGAVTAFAATVVVEHLRQGPR